MFSCKSSRMAQANSNKQMRINQTLCHGMMVMPAAWCLSCVLSVLRIHACLQLKGSMSCLLLPPVPRRVLWPPAWNNPSQVSGHTARRPPRQKGRCNPLHPQQCHQMSVCSPISTCRRVSMTKKECSAMAAMGRLSQALQISSGHQQHPGTNDADARDLLVSSSCGRQAAALENDTLRQLQRATAVAMGSSPLAMDL